MYTHTHKNNNGRKRKEEGEEDAAQGKESLIKWLTTIGTG
jgi:hypothetical protein